MGFVPHLPGEPIYFSKRTPINLPQVGGINGQGPRWKGEGKAALDDLGCNHSGTPDPGLSSFSAVPPGHPDFFNARRNYSGAFGFRWLPARFVFA